jgi:hypothetical protein
MKLLDKVFLLLLTIAIFALFALAASVPKETKCHKSCSNYKGRNFGLTFRGYNVYRI